MSDQTPYTPSIRDLIADEISGIVVGHGYYSTSVGITASLEIADAILASSLIAQVRAETLREAATIADEVDTQAERDLGIEYDGHAAEVAVRIRHRADRVEQGENDD